jgi:hypothetical protein
MVFALIRAVCWWLPCVSVGHWPSVCDRRRCAWLVVACFRLIVVVLHIWECVPVRG